jgi:hypothetical protein
MRGPGSVSVFSENAIKQILELSSGYPYFIQFICKEVFEVWIRKVGSRQAASVPVSPLGPRGNFPPILLRPHSLQIVRIRILPSC